VEQDSDDYLRVNLQSDGTNTQLVVVDFVQGQPPLLKASVNITDTTPYYLRLLRTSMNWQAFYSGDSMNWKSHKNLFFTRALAVSAVSSPRLPLPA
jgi:hypothetical protein